MKPFVIVLLVIGCLIVISLIVMIPIWLKIAQVIHRKLFIRKSDTDFSHSCSAPENKEHLSMYNEGLEWAKKHKQNKVELDIEHDGLKLHGEFYNFGYEKTVIFAPGRCESLVYCYYYAIGYENNNCNILVIDQRAHGFSDGKYVTAGIKEAQDMIAWINEIVNVYDQKSIILHGICVGGCAATLIATSKNCPKEVSLIIVDGLFESFTESVVQHTIQYGKPAFPVAYMVPFWFRHYAKVNLHKNAPKKIIKNIKIPTLFLHTKNDVYSLPKKTIKLFNKCGSPNKEIHWFDKGWHSHVRNNATEEYDKVVHDFIMKY